MEIKQNKSWSNIYLLDIPIIDSQHKMFFELYDTVFDLSKNKDKAGKDKISEVLVELNNYLKLHFKTEEQLMYNSNAEDIEDHISEHKFFINKVDEFVIGMQYGNIHLLETMLEFIKKWFLSHILNTDTRYKESVKTYLEK